MALYRLEAKIIGRSSARKGKAQSVSVVAKAAYRSGESLRDEQTGKLFNYRSRAQEVAHAEILAPTDAPSWATDRACLWNTVERTEKRKDSQLAREFVIALPVELSERQQVDLLRGWCRDALVSQGLVADVALHRSHDGRNPHAHILCTTRPVGADGFGKKPTTAGKWNGRGAVGLRAKDDLQALRASWEVHCNAALADAGNTALVDRRSLAARGIDREPQPKIGVAATAMQRRGLVNDPERVRAARLIGMENLIRPLLCTGRERGTASRWGRLQATAWNDAGQARDAPTLVAGMGRG